MCGGISFGHCLLALSAAFATATTSCFAADSVDSKRPTAIAASPVSRSLRSGARPATLTERLLSDARDGRLDDFNFIFAALIASGTSTFSDVTLFLDMYEPVKAGILGKLPAGTAIDRLKAIHAAAHDFFLTGKYHESCSDLCETFTSGDFNCLTSLAVCMDLCQAAGLNVQPMLARGHVLLAYQSVSGQTLAFEPGATEWQLRQSHELSGNRRLSVVELLGKFYYNRGVEQLREGRFETGLSLLRTSLALDQADVDARANLVAGLNNWAVEQCKMGHLDEAASLIDQGLTLDPTFAPLIANERFVRTKLGK
jgi:hypothetical protein